MWWLIGTGLFFCAFHFHWISSDASNSAKVWIGIGSLAVFWGIRRLILWKTISDDRSNLLMIMQVYQSRFGHGNQVRDTLTEFGNEFGGGYAEYSSQSGDIAGTLIGQGISMISNFLGNATKSSDQIELEQKIAWLSSRIDERTNRATASLVMMAISISTIIWLNWA